MEWFEFSAMNTRIVLVAEGDQASLAPAFARTREYIDAREAQFTRFRHTSELSALNHAAGTWFNASPEMFVLLQEAVALSQQTQGLFNPAILNALEHAGYDASIELVRARTRETRAPRRETYAENFSRIAFHDAARAVWMPPNMRIDLGGIAKGWIAEHAAYLLAEYAEVCAVNAGGDLFAIGIPHNAHAWEIEIEDPYDPARTVALLSAPGGALATSSITKRKWRQDAREQHHLIDPRTGLPAATDWLSVTVLAPHATIAEVFAKALLIGGSGEAGFIAGERDDIEFIAVDREGKLFGSEGVSHVVTPRTSTRGSHPEQCAC